MPLQTDEYPPSILPLPWMALLILVCVCLSLTMVPQRGELIDRLFKDGQHDRVIAVMKDEIHGSGVSGFGELQSLNTQELANLSKLLNQAPREQLLTIFSSKRPPEYDKYIHNIAVSAVQYVDVISPQDAAAIILPGIARVPDAMRPGLLDVLAQNAVAVGAPGLAADILSIACQSQKSTWDEVQKMVQACRWSSQPGKALAGLDKWLKRQSKDWEPDGGMDVRELRFNLAMESGNPAVALSICEQDLADKGVEEKLMDRALTVALQAQATDKILPWIDKFIAGMPESQLSLAQLHSKATSDSASVEKYRSWLTRLAQWLDWSGQNDKAFNHFVRLAVLGDKPSRERCLEVYDYLGRTEECCEMLLLIEKDYDSTGDSLVLARQLAELGHDEESLKRYDVWLKVRPNDVIAAYDRACLMSDMGDETAAHRAFAEVHQAFPKDVRTIKKLAEACIRDAEPEAALKLYEELPAEAHDAFSAENYTMLAESLDDHPARYRALQIETRYMEKPTPDHFLSLADAASQMEKSEAALAALQQGLDALPDSRVLRIAAAQELAATGRVQQAADMILVPALRDSYEAVQAVLDLAGALPDPAKTLAFLGDNVEKRFSLDVGDVLQLAVLHARVRDRGETDRIFAAIPETPQNCKMLAEARYDLGDYQEAARLMNIHLQATLNSDPTDWVFLGDIFEELGRHDEATHAYNHSILLLTADIPGTASN